MNNRIYRVFSVIAILALMLVGVPVQEARGAGRWLGFNQLDQPGKPSRTRLRYPRQHRHGEQPYHQRLVLDESGTGTANNGLYSTGTGSGNTGDTYSFGAASSAERAFGGLLSGSLTPIIGASFTNNTGDTITALDISYTGEMWRGV